MPPIPGKRPTRDLAPASPEPRSGRRRGGGTHLGVFLKAPVPGTVKTRLGTALGAGRAAELYRRLAADTLACVAAFPAEEATAFFSPPGAREACGELAPARNGMRFSPQRGTSLGERMEAAFDEIFRRGAERAILIGTDCPGLDGRILRAADATLRRRTLVLGPAADGGYYLIGLRRHEPRLFRGIPWSTARVLETTEERARAAGLEPVRLPELRDVDTWQDLLALREWLLSAWSEAAGGRRRDFPLQTFRYVHWQPGTPLRRRASHPAATRARP